MTAAQAFPDVQGISGTIERARAEGMPVSEYTLRRAIRSGSIPCRLVGRTYLVHWANVQRWLLCEDGCDNAPIRSKSGGIRRLEV